ncbi:McrB family protein [Shewanella oncorhynchi]|uniref:McrB family protein n=1 Tax=Shewanella oncorhynchi TaxID=2726434 RepID=UPI003D7A57BF
MKGNRDEVFSYIFSKADEVGYMGLDSASSGKFQDELENDPELIRIAGGKLSRNYIKDTVLNNYSKKQRYISEEDILSVFVEFENIGVLGSKKDLENGIFQISYLNDKFDCTSSSINEWQTVLKRFGKRSSDKTRFAFLTCGGVEKQQDELESAIDILNSYNVKALIVKPSQEPISIASYIKKMVPQHTNLVKTTLCKPFLLLAGISGTGKTRFVREQAKISGQFDETYCLTSVRPDWHEPSDLLGYISRLAKDGQAEYITTDVLQFIAKAWRAIEGSDLNIEIHDIEEQGERLVVTGGSEALKQVLPYWLCLDEMNLAPVEQYFADYLSVLETREWRWDGDTFTYSSDALLKPTTIKEVADKYKLRSELGFAASEYDELWQLICQYGLAIPFNLMVAGTVNMDETTHGFSRKVIDRALSFDFGAFFPNNYEEFFSPTSCNKRLSYPIWSQANKADLINTVDAYGSQTVAFLTAVNKVLKNTPFELAYRALNELLLAVVSCQPQDELTLKAVWDDFMMCKVLPRIEGDSDKLTTADGQDILVELNTVLAAQLAPIWQADKDDDPNQRPDQYREKVVAEGAVDKEKVLRISCRSKDKLAWMQQRLASATFTSFWP